jgi:LysR family glycine cleavage system transcriptional activator
MSQRLPPLNPLRAFEATARTGSISAAARELNVTHGAVSHQIKTLEASLGVSLFVRAGRKVRPSAQGALLLPSITNAFENIAWATAQLRRPATAGNLVIGCVPALLSFWLMPHIGSFFEQYPDIRVKFVPSNDPADLRKGEIDVHILYGDGNWTDRWVRHWTDLDLFPVISPSLLNKRPLRSVRDLSRHVLLHADDGQEWHAWLSSADALDVLHGRHHFMGNARLAIEAAMFGHGLALGDSITAKALLASGDLVVPFDRFVLASSSFYVTCRTEMRSAPIVMTFLNWIFASIENTIRPATEKPQPAMTLEPEF